MNAPSRLRLALFSLVFVSLLTSTLFMSSPTSSAQKRKETPQEIDVRSTKVAGQKATAVSYHAPTAVQLKTLNSLQSATGSRLSVQYNPLSGTPRHMFATTGYLTPPSANRPEQIAQDFIKHWQGVFDFSEEDVAALRLKSRATLPDMGVTILLFEQQVDGVPVYKGEVLVNVNRAGQIINVGGDSYPQLKITNSVRLSPAQAVAAAAADLGFENFTPQPTGAKRVPRTFGNLAPEFVEATRFSGGTFFTGDIVVTEVIFPMGREGRRAYNFALSTPQYRGIMWNNIVDAETGEVLRRSSLTAFQQGGGPVNSRRSTFRPDIQNLVEANNTPGTAAGKVFDGMPSALSGRRTCTGNIPGRPCNGAAGTGGTLGGGYGRSTAPGDQPDFQPNENELDRNNGRGFKKSLVAARTENAFAEAGSPLFSQIYNTPFGQVSRGFPDASNPTALRFGSRFGWFYLPTGTGGTEITESDNNRAATRAYKYEMPEEAQNRNLPANSPVANKSQPFSADLTPLASSVTLRDGRVLSTIFQSRYTEGNNVLVADDRFNDDETTTGIRGYSPNRQFTANYFTFNNGYEYGNADAKSAIPGTMGLVACTLINLCEVYDYPQSTEQDVYPGTLSLFYYTNLMHDYLYSLGFTEQTWNFQQDNFGLGGAGQDALSAQVQDGSGTDNANMSTGNDGSPPRMQMFLFTEGSFRRSDGDFDFDVVAHEFYHGVSNRSAGKGTADCLGTPITGESGGQGEGWSDAIACSMSDDDSEGEYVTGEYDIGIRRLPYTNYRWSYGSINGNGLNRRDQQPPDPDPGNIPFEVHDVGEVFAAMLWDMRELLIMKDPNGVFFDGTRRLNGPALTSSEFYIGPHKVRSRDNRHPIDYRAEFNTTIPGATVSGGPQPPGGITPPEQVQTQVPNIKADEHIVRPRLVATENQSNNGRNGPLATAVARGARLADTLVLRGLQLSPCNPSIVTSRDSILLADEELNGGENRSIIWRAFASHGVGQNALSSNAQGGPNAVVEDFNVPASVAACEQLGPLAAPSFTLSNGAPNRVTITINGGVPVVGAAQYIITRSFKVEGPYNKIAEIPATQTTYDDNNLSGGATYFYQVRASRDTETNCVSTANTQSITVSNGVAINPPPTFFGVDQVIDPKTGNSLVLKWNTAITPNASGDVFTACSDCVYDIYRVKHVEPGNGTQEPTFVPSDANRIAQGVSGNQYTDTNLQLGQIYYYIVQARNTGGKKDTDDTGNRQVRYNVPTINSFKSQAPFPLESYESSSADARFQPPLQESGDDPKEDQPVWQRVVNITQANGSVSSMMYAPDFDPGSDGANSDISAVVGPLTLSSTSIMDFDHFFSTEARFDGGVLEIAKGGPNFNSTPYPDNVTTYDLGNYIVEGLYNSRLDGDLAGTGVPGTALTGRRAYTGIKGIHHVRVALGEFAPGGQNNQEGAPIFLRFRMSSDVGTSKGADSGWYVDNLVIHDLGTSDATPTPTPTPVASPTPTPTPVATPTPTPVSTPTPTATPTPTPTPTATPTPGATPTPTPVASPTPTPTPGASPTPTPAATPTPTPAPNSIVQFGSASYTVGEDCTQLVVQVVRTGTNSARATVDVASVDGTAKQKGDYNYVAQRLTFEPGETQKSVPVLVNEDSYSEGPETFTLALSNPTGQATLGTTSNTTIQIADDSTESSNNPIDDAAIFVCQHYHDFLNRQADANGQAFWTNQIAGCGTNAGCIDNKRNNVSQAFFLSIEFQQTGYFVIRIHKASFGSEKSNPRYTVFLRDQREISDGVVIGQAGAAERLEANRQKYLEEFVSRAEFASRYPQGMTASAYVDTLFAKATVTPTQAERQEAINAYGSGNMAGRVAALRSVVETGSVYNRQYNPAFVLMQYFGYLRRNPDDAPDNNFSGYDFWLAKMNQFSQPGEDVRNEEVARSRVARAEMVRAFIVSGEYRQRFAGSPTGNQQGQSPEGSSLTLRHLMEKMIPPYVSPEGGQFKVSD